MIMWKLIFLWIPYLQAAEEGLFECGAHGKFEYCIDDIPGCVIGCHCHPGYYFDTETKICEPNTKLTQNYRRQYMAQPTRGQKSVYLENAAEEATVPILTTHNVLDEHVNDITKNADDLGDWLYNQFFKTIENQVINNTHKDNQITRRSSHVPDLKLSKSKRRLRKRGKKRHKKKRKGMKGKLLQIAEDDSLFESSYSESDYDSSSSDKSRSSSSFEFDSDEDHGHKKILMINKKPKPPLPSFIFLPNMNTPYFPPIGLPPPPVMPMYPMVPVPPVVPAPPIFPYPGFLPECDENKTTTTISTTNGMTTAETISTTTDFSEPPTTTDIEVPTTSAPAHRSRVKGRKRGKMKPFKNIPDYDVNPTFENFNPKRSDRQKLLQRLRQRINNQHVKKNRDPFDNYMNQFISPDVLKNNNNPDRMMYKNENSPLDNVEVPDEENVDFKYLSQLIHKVNDNQTQDVPLGVYNPYDYQVNSREQSQKQDLVYNGPIYGRRMNTRLKSSQNGKSDDLYYSNLGRQIASLIRTVDADNVRQVDLEVEKRSRKPEEQTFFNENAPRAFWERFVRSPFKYYNLIKNRYDYLKSSNELLLNIENKVKKVASTVPTLSLQEIENIIKVMETAQSQIQNHPNFKNVKPSSKTLNINLWPQEIKQSKNSIKTSTRPNVFNIKKRTFIEYSNNTRPEISNLNLNNIHSHKVYSFSNEINMHKVNDYSRDGSQIEPYYKSTSTKLYFVKNRTEATYSQSDQKPNEFTVQLQYSFHPTALNNKKYFFDDNNQNTFQDNALPIRYSAAKIIRNPPINSIMRSPYFHQELNHVIIA